MYLWFGSILKSFFYDQIWILMMFSKVPRFESERKLNHWPGGRHQVVCSEGQRILLGPRAALKTFKFAWIHHSVLHSTLQQVFCMKTDRFHEMSNTGVSSCRILSSKAETWNVSGQVCVCPWCLLPARGGGKMTIDLEQECHLVLWSESRRCYPQICVVVIYISIHGLRISCWPHQGSLPNLAL